MTSNEIYNIKYAPKSFDEIIGHKNIIHILKSLLANNSLPHMLFYGNSGTGKSLIINIITNILYGKNESLMVLSLHSCDDRGINTVRDIIKSFVEKVNMFINGTRMIILDEIDSMTSDAQFALRKIIEIYSVNVRFCLICNNLNKIITALKSRCALFHFMNLSKKDIYDRLKFISSKENLKLSNYTLKYIVYKANGDMRKAINDLQRNIEITKPPSIESLMNLPYIGFINSINKYYSLEEAILYITKNIEKYNNDFIIELCDFEYISSKTIVEDIHISYFCSFLQKHLCNS